MLRARLLAFALAWAGMTRFRDVFRSLLGIAIIFPRLASKKIQSVKPLIDPVKHFGDTHALDHGSIER